VAFVLSTCPDDRLRDGRSARFGARRCIELLRSPQHLRAATIVLALAEAECGEVDEAVQTLSRALEVGEPGAEIRASCEQLKGLFEQGKPYRYDPRQDAPAPFRLDPAIVFIN
jgi:hypothetical protein